MPSTARLRRGSPQLLRVCGKAFPELRDEALAFPAAAHDDLLDALAGAYDNAPSRGVIDVSGWQEADPRDDPYYNPDQLNDPG